MRSSALALAVILVLPAGLVAQQAAELTGTLDKEPVPGSSPFSPLRLQIALPQTQGLPAPLGDGDKVFAGRLAWSRGSKLSARVALVEPAQGEPYVYVDTDLDGKLSAAERINLPPKKEDWMEGVVLRFPLQQGPVRSYPVRLMRPANTTVSPGDRLLVTSISTYLDGTFDLAGRKIRVRYTLDPGTGTVDLKGGELGVDGDGDGTIDTSFGSPEWDFAQDDAPVFKVGERYVSTKSADPATGRIVLATHPATDYVRFDLRPGTQVPDFAFTDFTGKPRKLSELRGKYVLLDFWATWCLPCLADFPHLLEVHRTYGPRGFEILGMNVDEDLAAAKKMVANKGLGWPQATRESIEDLVNRRFRVRIYPTAVLLDPQGKVVTTGGGGGTPLNGKKVGEMLAKLLPAG